MNINETIDIFQALDNRSRLEMLLTYSEDLPPLPPERAADRNSGIGRVHECQTPVWLWVDVEDGIVHLQADVDREAPTVRGFLSLLVDALNGRPVDEVLALPVDIVSRLGLTESLGMVRMRGLNGIVGRIRREVETRVNGR